MDDSEETFSESMKKIGAGFAVILAFLSAIGLVGVSFAYNGTMCRFAEQVTHQTQCGPAAIHITFVIYLVLFITIMLIKVTYLLGNELLR